jgi:parvulin-like peptidyl-prolyl isomerase
MSWLLSLMLACGDAPVEVGGQLFVPTAPIAEAPDEGLAPLEEELPELRPEAPDRIAARHILIAYQGAVKAPPALRRTREEAWAIAGQVLAKARAGEDFPALARAHSDGPSAALGGNLYSFSRGAMDLRFEVAAFNLDEGQLSDLVETPFGFHIIRREALVEIRVAHVLVQWADLSRTAAKRTAEQAQIRADEIHARLVAGEDVAVVAKDLSDGPTAMRGGDLGWFQRGQMLPEFDAAAFALDVGQVSGVITTTLGHHVIVRLE